MKPNDGCALEKLVDDHWIPLAIRYQRLNSTNLRLLALGETIAKDAAQIRRYDWQERQALAAIFRE